MNYISREEKISAILNELKLCVHPTDMLKVKDRPTKDGSFWVLCSMCGRHFESMHELRESIVDPYEWGGFGVLWYRINKQEWFRDFKAVS